MLLSSCSPMCSTRFYICKVKVNVLTWWAFIGTFESHKHHMKNGLEFTVVAKQALVAHPATYTDRVCQRGVIRDFSSKTLSFVDIHHVYNFFLHFLCTESSGDILDNPELTQGTHKFTCNSITLCTEQANDHLEHPHGHCWIWCTGCLCCWKILR